MTTSNEYNSYKPFLFFSISFLLLLTYYSSHFLLTEEVFYNYYAEQLSIKQLEELLNKQREWAWLGYIILPITYLIKVTIIAGCIYTGLFFYKSQQWNFSILFGMVVKADLIFLLSLVLKVVWFSIHTDYTLTEFQTFIPFSIINLFDVSTVDKWLLYPLQVLNIFEVLFWFLLALQLRKYIGSSLNISFQIVLFSYGTGLLLWVVFVTFLSLNAT